MEANLRDRIVPHHLPSKGTLVLGILERTWYLADVVQEDWLTIQARGNAAVNAKDLAVDHRSYRHVIKSSVDLLPHLLSQSWTKFDQTLSKRPK